MESLNFRYKIVSHSSSKTDSLRVHKLLVAEVISISQENTKSTNLRHKFCCSYYNSNTARLKTIFRRMKSFV